MNILNGKQWKFSVTFKFKIYSRIDKENWSKLTQFGKGENFNYFHFLNDPIRQPAQ